MNRRLAGLLIGLGSAALVLLLSLLDPSLFGTEWLYYDAAARSIARRTPPDPRIVIVALNDTSIRALEPFYGRPPYTRALMEIVVEEVRRGGGKLVVFDFLFSEENPNDPAGDRAFAEALRTMPSVLAAETRQTEGLTPPHAFRQKLWRIAGSVPKPEPLRLTTPIPMFAGVTAIGTISMPVKEREATNREYGLVEQVDRELYIPTLALAAASVQRGLPSGGFFARDEFSSGGLKVPVTRNGTFLISWHRVREKPPDEINYALVDLAKVVAVGLSRRDPESAAYTVEEMDSFSRQTFDGKIALVAMTATGATSDFRATPLSPVSAGVEIHANALDNLLNDRFNREAPWMPMFLVVLAISAICGLILHPLRSPLLASVVALLFIVGWLGAGYLAMDRGVFIRSIAPSVAILSTFIASTAINVIAEQRQTRYLRATFGHYVSPQVLDYLLSDPTRVSLGGERRELTILFSDIRGFTSISEASQPEEVVEMLNEYLSRMVEILLRHGGTLDKFIGDAVMGFWNAPTADPDHPRHAVECAIEMIGETARLRDQWTAEGKAPIRIGIGINTGEAVVGNIGSSQVFGYTVIGDAVNLASRLEGKNKDYGTEIIISEMTRDRLGGGIDSVYLDEVKVKGKERAVRIFEVKGKLS